MRADYQLEHQLYGQQGSLWEKQVDETTRRQIRRIVKEAGNAATLAYTDRVAARVTNLGKVLVKDVFFKFVTGNYAVVGQAQRDYNFRVEGLEVEKRLHVAYRGFQAANEPGGIPTQIARVSQDFLRYIAASDLPTDRDWYLIPTPVDTIPLVIESNSSDEHLVNGVDFTAHDGYIAMSDDPETVFISGVVKISAGYRRVPLVSSTGTGRYLSEYFKKAQSLAAFKRAAAEYAGLYVTQTADVVLDARQTSDMSWVYNLAAAGAVEIDYPHAQLFKNQSLPPGFIISSRFDVISSKLDEVVNLKKTAALDWDSGIILDGILPVNGLTWDGKSRVAVDYVAVGVDDKPHLRLYFDGPTLTLARFWEVQRLHELKTGVYLSDEIGTPDSVDFWDIIENFYGPQLFLVLLADHSPKINTRLWRFVLDHRPQSCNALIGVDLGVDLSSTVNDAQGIPLLDEYGENYFVSGDPLAGLNNYYRPDGVSLYLRPSGVGYYLRPG